MQNAKQIIVKKVMKIASKHQFRGDFWSEWGESNSRHLAPKRLNQIFSVRFRPFPVVSARFSVLSASLNSTVSVCSEAVCGQTCGQKALLDQVRHPLPPSVQKGSFSYSGLGYCTSGEGKMQGISPLLSGMRLYPAARDDTIKFRKHSALARRTSSVSGKGRET